MAKWEVGPTKDVIEAFMEVLVDPRLPRRVSHDIDPPSEDAQKSVARQMHAVVLLYNYYHRRQKPELEFLDFVSFCKLAVILRKPMSLFMKLMNESEPVELNGVEDQLSVTEKAIKNACNIALALDASVDVPNAEGWPISRIAVILLDKSNEICRLQYGALTEGVWSTYEIYTNESLKVVAKNNVGTGKKRKENADSEFLQLAYDVVKKNTGIHHSDLVVVGTDVTYSLSKEKSATQVYLIRCPRTFSPSNDMPIKLLVESLQGPLAKKDFGSWMHTPVVVFHHMLPYMGFILRWLSGEGLHLPSSSDWITASPVLSYNGKDLDHKNINRFAVKTEYCDEIVNHNSDHIHKKSKKTSRGEATTTAKDVNCPANSWEFTNQFLDSAIKDSSIIYLLDSDEETAGLRSFYQSLKDNSAMVKFNKRSSTMGSARALGTKSSRKAVTDGSGAKKLMKTCVITSSVEKEKSRINSKNSDKERGEIQKVGSSSNPPIWMRKMITSELSKTLANGEGTDKKRLSKINKRKNVSSTQHDVRSPNAKLNVGMVNPLESHESRDEMVSAENGVLTIGYDQNEVAVTERRLTPFEAVAKNNIREQSVPPLVELQNALALVVRERDGLSSQICNMQDKLAVCEDNIERIRNADDVGVARACINKHGSQIQEVHQPDEDHSKSGPYLVGQSSCQDLECMCQINNWKSPKYVVEASNGKFLSYLFVSSQDFKLSSKGGLESNPREARESAAAQMIAKIHDHFTKVVRR